MNTRLNNFLKALAGLLLLGCTESSFALQPGSERMLLIAKGDVPWQSLSPEEQRELKGYRGNWKNYDTEKQNRIRDGAKRYMHLPPERKEKNQTNSVNTTVICRLLNKNAYVTNISVTGADPLSKHIIWHCFS